MFTQSDIKIKINFCLFLIATLIAFFIVENYSSGMLYVAKIGLVALLLLVSCLAFTCFSNSIERTIKVYVFAYTSLGVVLTILVKHQGQDVAFWSILYLVFLGFIFPSIYGFLWGVFIVIACFFQLKGQVDMLLNIKNSLISIIIVFLVYFFHGKSIKDIFALQNKAYTDKLTGLFNRHYYADVFMFSELLSEGGCVFMIDIDLFKKVNDQYGHDYGDKVISRVASVLQSRTRKGDFCFRYGGEEFLMVFPGLVLREAESLAEVLRGLIEKEFFEDACSITISVGGAAYLGKKGLDVAIACADSALYEAKGNGRNCSVLSKNVEN